MLLNQSLPFSDFYFLYFALFFIGVVGIVKKFFSAQISYKYLLALGSLIYIGILYTKPFHLLALVLLLFGLVKLLHKKYNSENLILPMITLALPMILMKIFNVLPIEDSHESLQSFKGLIQIAGMSYLVFKVMGLYVDTRNKKEPVSFIDFFTFTTFVPSLLIGPIDRFHRFKNDIQNGYSNIHSQNILKAWDELILGLLYKFVISVLIYRVILEQLPAEGGLFYYHLPYMYGYLLFLFFDFAGYSLLALSFARFIGIQLPRNFDKPFLTQNPKEFWKHWHISLGDWLNDYFFKPLFKYFTTKKLFTGPQRQGLALFITFLLMGFWNGFEIHFILSGALFGLYSVIHNAYTIRCKKKNKDVIFGNANKQVVRIISIFVLFNLVAFAIYIFSGNLI
jgi:membrane protein involved in D-alanine export